MGLGWVFQEERREANPMATIQATQDERTSDIAIFARLIKANDGDLSRDLARYILTLGFEEQDQARMRELAEKNQEGALTLKEEADRDWPHAPAHGGQAEIPRDRGRPLGLQG
jgi:hypothetical protein